MSSHKGDLTYENAMRGLNKTFVWPGCGKDGRYMPCGRVHDFGWYVYVGLGQREWHPQVECWMRHEKGCPQPNPEPLKKKAPWVNPIDS